MEKKMKNQKAKSKSSEARKQLSSVRVIQRNLVYIVGLPLNLADEDVKFFLMFSMLVILCICFPFWPPSPRIVNFSYSICEFTDILSMCSFSSSENILVSMGRS